MFMAAMAMVLPWKNRWRFSMFCKRYKTLTLTLKICILQENGFKELTLVLFERLFWGLHILFYSIFGQTIYWSTAKPWTSPKKKKVQMTLKDQSFVNKVSFVCVQPWRRVTFKFWEMLKNVSEVILVTKNIFFLKILNFVQSFVECKVSLADGTVICRSLVLQRLQEVAHYPLTSSCCPPGNTLLFAFNV